MNEENNNIQNESVNPQISQPIEQPLQEQPAVESPVMEQNEIPIENSAQPAQVDTQIEGPQFSNIQMPSAPVQPNFNQQPTVQTYEQPKNSKKGLIIALSIVGGVLTFIIIGLVLNSITKNKINSFIDSVETSNTILNNDSSSSKKAFKSSYNIETYELADGNLLLEIENDGSSDIRLDGKINYYDDSDNLIDNDEVYIDYLPKGKTTYKYIYSSLVEQANSYKVKVNASEPYSEYKDYSNKIEYTDNETEEGIMIEAANSSNVELDVDFYALFYSNGEIIGYSQSFETIAASDSTSSKIYAPRDKNYQNIIYDSYVIFVEAYK